MKKNKLLKLDCHSRRNKKYLSPNKLHLPCNQKKYLSFRQTNFKHWLKEQGFNPRGVSTYWTREVLRAARKSKEVKFKMKRQANGKTAYKYHQKQLAMFIFSNNQK
ncbi:hypothetical protein MZJ28_003643 [Vibrio parahaemolyticus]|uniref:hypothetical protein n=1 Tax=Vibrio parahaemolyticus TaxID=670 RepID=UPI0004A4EE63|nr:hypothetical protein [Vibrio parahaemolyticus]EGQ8134953.1 hypothetical protein [Vibrio parahaemolyticus]EGQ8150719.1 hypothetical protein [Vibrio parahaemolyticus]EGQ8249856.1 hypothetical protein [Vibrio parahaemolyticus]EGQ8267177.1 hypothetical protein [Vibrio parahaemolyticus]EGQ8272245.1 hypothetical protein [Vibrio parahaemolyticus]